MKIRNANFLQHLPDPVQDALVTGFRLIFAPIILTAVAIAGWCGFVLIAVLRDRCEGFIQWIYTSF